jgi:class 3 adenylate cyclase
MKCASNNASLAVNLVLESIVGKSYMDSWEPWIEEFTVIGDAVNRAARYCAAAAGGQILISPEVYERVWKMTDTERVTIKTKHEGDFVAYRVKGIKATVSGQRESRTG